MNSNTTSIVPKLTYHSQKVPDQLIIFSHLRWDFVYQRPQHLATRFSEKCILYFIEEPVFDAVEKVYYETVVKGNLKVMVPHLYPGLDHQFTINSLSQLFKDFIELLDLANTAFWYYTPMALEFSGNFEPAIIIYDCMDELSAFKFAPDAIQTLEKELLNKADVVFTGGYSLYNAKKDKHHNIHPFPSSIDIDHFAAARKKSAYPSDQINTDMPKLGFYGVIDERFDIELIKTIADERPNWQIILIGPIVKIDPATLPDNKNIHYLGSKTYDQLPGYLAGWDIALIPFLINESTRYISPTKTPEYLAAGLPVISTPITDVVDPYGVNNLVYIGKDAKEFIKLAEKSLNARGENAERLCKVDSYLAPNSWDKTYENMKNEIIKITEIKKVNSSSVQYV